MKKRRLSGASATVLSAKAWANDHVACSKLYKKTLSYPHLSSLLGQVEKLCLTDA